MTARLYGRAIGHGSLSVVTAGFRETLETTQLLEGFYALDKSAGSEEEDPPPGALARDAVFTGNLNLLNLMRIGTRHERFWLTVTPNSTHIPKRLLGWALTLPNPQILSASAWGTGVIKRNLEEMGGAEEGVDAVQMPDGPRVTIHTVRHGVSGFAPVPDALAAARDDYTAGKFRVVHFSTTDGERKGTLELIQAWHLAKPKLPRAAGLCLVLDHHARNALVGRMIDCEISMPDGVEIVNRAGLGSEDMSRFLGRHHLVCAPSRGEGFGLLPLEARASGVPVATTTLTGCSAGHCEGPGVLEIPQDPDLLPIDDGPGALSPGVDPVRVAEAIGAAYDGWRALSAASEEHAAHVIEAWSWRQQLGQLVEKLRAP